MTSFRGARVHRTGSCGYYIGGSRLETALKTDVNIRFQADTDLRRAIVTERCVGNLRSNSELTWAASEVHDWQDGIFKYRSPDVEEIAK